MKKDEQIIEITIKLKKMQLIEITIYKQTKNEHKQQITYNRIHYTSILVPTCSCHQANRIHFTSSLHSMIKKFKLVTHQTRKYNQIKK